MSLIERLEFYADAAAKAGRVEGGKPVEVDGDLLIRFASAMDEAAKVLRDRE